MEYEQTLLRDVLKDEMEDLQPGWKMTYEQSSVRADFEEALHMCDDMFNNVVRKWLEGT